MRDHSSFARKLEFLVDLTADVVAQARIQPGACVGPHGPNATQGPLIRPGGRDCYPAFWIRDFSMSLETGLVSADELQHALFLTAHLQTRDPWHTPSGSVVPRGAVADHITLAGVPIYFPGTLDDAEHQGGPWGKLPPFDDPFYLIDMAWHLACVYQRPHCLSAEVHGMPLLSGLDLAFHMPPSRPDTQLVWCGTANRGVSFGFVDTVMHTGDLLFSSLLKYKAAQQMAELHALCHGAERARLYNDVARRISAALFAVFGSADGLLHASTGCSSQPDVWGSAFAVYTGALQPQAANRVCRAIARHYAAGTISWKGQIRHVPTGHDVDATTMWERLVRPYAKNTYQNGAYWGTPTGWVCFALAQHREEAARELALDYLDALQEADFRQGEHYGAPYECMHPDGDYTQNPVYMTSVTCPLAGFQRLGWL